jgi:hypothetical protein
VTTEVTHKDDAEVNALLADSEPEPTPQVSEAPTSPVFEAAVAEADAILDALMARIGDVESHTKWLKVLLYGNPGTRKTVFTATAPKPLIIDIEKGAHSIRNHPDVRDEVKVLEFKSIFQAEQLLNYLARKDDIPGLADRQTCVVDSFSELSKRDLDEIVTDAASKDASRNKYLPTGPDYNISTEHMRQFASKLRDLPMHVIVTCHVKEEKDESTGRLLVRPNLTPKLAGTLAGMFDVVGYMQLDNDTAKLQVHPTNTVTAKTRIGGLPPIIENPTFNDLLTAFNKEIN